MVNSQVFTWTEFILNQILPYFYNHRIWKVYAHHHVYELKSFKAALNQNQAAPTPHSKCFYDLGNYQAPNKEATIPSSVIKEAKNQVQRTSVRARTNNKDKARVLAKGLLSKPNLKLKHSKYQLLYKWAQHQRQSLRPHQPRHSQPHSTTQCRPTTY